MCPCVPLKYSALDLAVCITCAYATAKGRFMYRPMYATLLCHKTGPEQNVADACAGRFGPMGGFLVGAPAAEGQNCCCCGLFFCHEKKTYALLPRIALLHMRLCTPLRSSAPNPVCPIFSFPHGFTWASFTHRTSAHGMESK